MKHNISTILNPNKLTNLYYKFDESGQKYSTSVQIKIVLIVNKLNNK